jgi:hypothetical protein
MQRLPINGRCLQSYIAATAGCVVGCVVLQWTILAESYYEGSGSTWLALLVIMMVSLLLVIRQLQYA